MYAIRSFFVGFILVFLMLPCLLLGTIVGFVIGVFGAGIKEGKILPVKLCKWMDDDLERTKKKRGKVR